MRREKSVERETTRKFLFIDVRYMNLALDANPDHELFVCVSLPVDIYENGKVVKSEMGLAVISDKPEYFACTEEELRKRKIRGLIPKTELKQRWAASKIKEFLDGKAQKVNPFEVYQAVKAKFLYYIDYSNNPHVEVLDAIWVLGTYFYFLFLYYPYRKIGGLKGVGKSKHGSVVEALAFNVKSSAGMTESAIFRFAQDTRGTLVIDEAEGFSSKKSEEYQALRKVLLSGFRDGGSTDRVNKDTLKVESYSTYNPKEIISIAGVEEVLDDRVFETIIQKSMNAEIMTRQPNVKSPEWQPIRNDLHLLLMQKWKEVREIYDSLQPSEITGRLWDMAKPLISIAKFIDRYAPTDQKIIEQELMLCIKAEVERKRNTQLEGETARVLNALWDVLKPKTEATNYKHVFLVKDVCKKIQELEGWADPPRERSTALILRNLRLYEKSKRSSKGYQFEISKDDLTIAANTNGIEIDAVSLLASSGSSGSQSSQKPNEPNEPSEPSEAKGETPTNHCPVCQEYFFSQELLFNHVLSHDIRDRKCPFCHEGPFNNGTTLRDHLFDTCKVIIREIAN